MVLVIHIFRLVYNVIEVTPVLFITVLSVLLVYGAGETLCCEWGDSFGAKFGVVECPGYVGYERWT
jgi:hypothetical protein